MWYNPIFAGSPVESSLYQFTEFHYSISFAKVDTISNPYNDNLDKIGTAKVAFFFETTTAMKKISSTISGDKATLRVETCLISTFSAQKGEINH